MMDEVQKKLKQVNASQKLVNKMQTKIKEHNAYLKSGAVNYKREFDGLKFDIGNFLKENKSWHDRIYMMKKLRELLSEIHNNKGKSNYQKAKQAYEMKLKLEGAAKQRKLAGLKNVEAKPHGKKGKTAKAIAETLDWSESTVNKALKVHKKIRHLELAGAFKTSDALKSELNKSVAAGLRFADQIRGSGWGLP